MHNDYELIIEPLNGKIQIYIKCGVGVIFCLKLLVFLLADISLKNLLHIKCDIIQSIAIFYISIFNSYSFNTFQRILLCSEYKDHCPLCTVRTPKLHC